jgi:hypothetical protein
MNSETDPEGPVSCVDAVIAVYQAGRSPNSSNSSATYFSP